MVKKKPRILLIIPCYNEEKSIQNLLEEIKALDNCYDTIVIDDGSDDNTAEKAKKHSPVIQLLHNLGIGSAVQTGIRYAYRNNYDFCIQIDGDGQHIPDEIAKLLKHQEETNNAITVGTRFLENPSLRSTWARYFGNKVISLILNRLFVDCRITDPTSGMRLMNLNAMSFFSRQYPLDFPEPISLAWALKRKMGIGETPVKMRPRKYGRSSISLLKSFSYMFRVSALILVCRFITKTPK